MSATRAIVSMGGHNAGNLLWIMVTALILALGALILETHQSAFLESQLMGYFQV